MNDWPHEIKRIERRQQQRLEVLKRVYQCTEIRGEPGLALSTLKDQLKREGLKYPEKDLEKAICYLEGESLIKMELYHANDPNSQVLYMLHKGIKEMEDIIEFPEGRTEHFSVPVINHFYAQAQVHQGVIHTHGPQKGAGEDA
ncbi:hypothetical protein [Deinococcus roseus]|uniref:Uncharacterized protein n=1 Tax=Deinococcus roseus TaxID=392414 RepID=A0ABQ2D697_9DEIO|nr:hypothetical protein [Deinococcus roseus]GGJ47694.1 hypothetical protein GCM10008938_37080 [Deinococcus roseus]